LHISAFTIKKTHIGSVYIVSSDKLKKNPADANLPAKLATKQAMGYWQRAQEAGWIDDNYQLLITKAEASLLADYMGRKLKLTERWKPFADLWQLTTLRKDYDQAFGSKKGGLFMDLLKEKLED